MTIWQQLGLPGPTNDKRAIKKAYAGVLKETHPEDDPEGFQRLHSAYKQALEQAAHIEMDSHPESWGDTGQHSPLGENTDAPQVAEQESHAGAAIDESVYQADESLTVDDTNSTSALMSERVDQLFKQAVTNDSAAIETLKEWLQEDFVNLDQRQALEIQILQAVQAAHRRRLVLPLTFLEALQQQFGWQNSELANRHQKWSGQLFTYVEHYQELQDHFFAYCLRVPFKQQLQNFVADATEAEQIYRSDVADLLLGYAPKGTNWNTLPEQVQHLQAIQDLYQQLGAEDKARTESLIPPAKLKQVLSKRHLKKMVREQHAQTSKSGDKSSSELSFGSVMLISCLMIFLGHKVISSFMDDQPATSAKSANSQVDTRLPVASSSQVVEQIRHKFLQQEIEAQPVFVEVEPTTTAHTSDHPWSSNKPFFIKWDPDSRKFSTEHHISLLPEELFKEQPSVDAQDLQAALEQIERQRTSGRASNIKRQIGKDILVGMADEEFERSAALDQIDWLDLPAYSTTALNPDGQYCAAQLGNMAEFSRIDSCLYFQNSRTLKQRKAYGAIRVPLRRDGVESSRELLDLPFHFKTSTDNTESYQQCVGGKNVEDVDMHKAVAICFREHINFRVWVRPTVKLGECLGAFPELLRPLTTRAEFEAAFVSRTELDMRKKNLTNTQLENQKQRYQNCVRTKLSLTLPSSSGSADTTTNDL